jgi:hypothetical protein
MGVGGILLNFLQRIAIGAGVVIALVLVIQLGMPGRSSINIKPRRTN